MLRTQNLLNEENLDFCSFSRAVQSIRQIKDATVEEQACNQTNDVPVEDGAGKEAMSDPSDGEESLCQICAMELKACEATCCRQCTPQVEQPSLEKW